MASIAVREEPVPERLPHAVVRGPLIEAAPGAVLLRIPGVARFLVQAGEATLVERASTVTDADVRCFVDEAVAAAAELLAGRVVLRGAAVSIGERAVVLCGHSCAGKSALAAALALRGHAVVADAVAAVSLEPSTGKPVVFPVAPEPILWPDTVAELGLADAQSRPVRPALAKRAYRVGAPSPTRPLPLAAVVVLTAEPGRSSVALEPVAGALRLQTLLAARWYQRLVGPLGLSAAHFDLLARVAEVASCLDLRRPGRGATSAVLAQVVENAVT